MNKIIFTAALLLIGTVLQASPLWLRYPSISPNGKEIAFSYKGNLYKVATEGGQAYRLTTHTAYDYTPVWSPDGKEIAFASDRHGHFDLFLISSNGGTPRRLTTHSGGEKPYAFTPDGKSVVFGAQLQDPTASALHPNGSMTELYQVATVGGRAEQILATPAEKICFNKSGDAFLYQDKKGGENEWRKHHTSSITRDICLYNLKTGEHRTLVDWQGEDRDPVFAPDERAIYFLSERSESFNVYTMPLDQPEQVEQITEFKQHPVRFLSIAGNGTLCYGFDGGIYTQTPGGKPLKVDIKILPDDNTDKTDYMVFSRGATEATVSPDGKQVALIIRGEVFVTSTDYQTTKQISTTPEQESGLSFAPDNRTLAYASERGGNWNIYLAKIKRSDDPNFPNATQIEETPLFKASTTERFLPRFSPDGKELAFVENRSRLMVMNLETKKVRQITDGSKQYNTSGGIDYAWSPDGKWFTLEYTANKHDPYGDIGIVSAAGGQPIINLTNSGYANENPRWVLDGNAILFKTEMYGMRNHASWGSQNDVMLVFLNRKTYDQFRLNKEDHELQKEIKPTATSDEKKKEKDKIASPANPDIVVELQGIEDRIVRLTPNSSTLGDAMITKDGGKLYYMSAFEGNYDLWTIDLRSRATKLLHKLNSGWVSLTMDKDGKNLFLLGSQHMQKISLSNDSPKSISYRAEMAVDREAERAYMFDRVYRQEQNRFYVTDMHGVDWPMLRKAYEKFLPSINNNYDFAELLSELLGELNVSHTGCRYRSGGGEEETASLGLLFDIAHTKDGLLIDEIVEGGPFDVAASRVKAGDLLEKIDGTLITADMDYYPLLNRKRGNKTLISFYRPSTKERWEEVIRPISNSMFSGLLYSRWVKQRAADVEKLSGGRLGYVHIPSMGDPSFRNVYSQVLGKYNHCDGIVIDTRFNGGGRMHEDIEILFSGEKYFTQVVRGKESCDMPSRRYNKPSIMLVCEANYSNAHGTPWVYRHRNLGKLVGMPVPGTMTSVSWETLQDPSLVFGIPVVGYRLPDGSYLENTQLEPDFKVANTPGEITKGRDLQLEKAVEELLKEIRK